MTQQDSGESESKATQNGTSDPIPAATGNPKINTNNLTYFGYTERPAFERMSAARSRWFRPLVQALIRRGVRPNHVTAASFLVLVIGFPLFFWLKLYFWAFFTLVLHIFLDGLDGPMARETGTDSPAGELLDGANDVTGMLIVVITASHYQFMNPTIGFIYASAYLYITFVAMAQNVLNIPFRFVGKTKYPVYILLCIRAAGGVDITTWFCVVAIAYMVIHIAVATDNILNGLRKS